MKERGVRFTSEMVVGILDGRKKKTRLVIKLPPAPNHLGKWEPFTIEGPGVYLDRAMTKPLMNPIVCIAHSRTGNAICCPSQVGDLLWVRETFLARNAGRSAIHKAGIDPVEAAGIGAMYGGWKSGRFMPRKFARIFLEVVGVRVERVQDISEADAIAEGATLDDKWTGAAEDLGGSYREAFRYLWDSINEKSGFGWAANPWVWCVTFKRVK